MASSVAAVNETATETESESENRGELLPETEGETRGARLRQQALRQQDRLVTFATFAAAVALALIFAPGLKVPAFPYDAGYYWGNSGRFTVDGTWSLWNFNDSLRGYVPALLFDAVRRIGEAFNQDLESTARIFNALLFAWIGTVLAPRVAELAWPRARFGYVRRLLLVGLLLVFWRGYVDVPLADFPALAAALVALLAVSRAASPPWLLVAGLATALAINIRPAYLLFVPAILVLGVWNGRVATPRISGLRRALGLAALVVGIAIVMVPQSIMNNKHYDLISPIPGAAEDLTGFQLEAGLVLQRYETYVGPAERSPSMRYEDPHTVDIVKQVTADGGIDGYGDYLRIAVENPITIAGVFLRHVVNGMDQRYSSTYIYDLDNGGQRPMRIAAMLIAFLALLRIAWPAARRSLGDARWRYPVALVATCVTILPSAVETRFLLPLYLLTYLLVLAPNWPVTSLVGPRSLGVRRFVPLGAVSVGLLVFVAVWWYIVSETSKTLI